MSDTKQFCLTLDLENDWNFDEAGYDHLVFNYLDEFIKLIQSLDVPLSIFVVGKAIEKFPEEIDKLRNQLDCEFHLHSYSHDLSKQYDFGTEVRRGKQAYRSHFGRDPIGYRAPQGNIETGEFRILEEEGFKFDSSIFPSYRPGVYQNLGMPLEPYIPPESSELIEFPLGVIRGVRIPLSQSYFKLIGTPLGKLLDFAPLPDICIYNIHLHDIYETDSHDQLPPIKKAIFKRNMDRSETMLINNIKSFKHRGYCFTKMSTLVTDQLDKTRDQI
jgi:peptidoglycan/xylan/chitin deacetylase (PgdA/CDA1 family)